MKKYIIYGLLLLTVLINSCQKTKYPGGVISPYIPIYDLKNLYKGSDLTLTAELMYGSNAISGVVISDHSGGNLPAGLLIIQDKKRLSLVRGISIPIGADATKYVPGDSVAVTISGGVLTRANGLLQVTGIAPTAVTKLGSGKTITPNRVGSNLVLARPQDYESSLVAIVKGGFDPIPQPTDTYSGDKLLNDGFDNIILHTEATATFANNTGLPFSANYYGIVIPKIGSDGKLVAQHRIRTLDDVVVLSSTVEIPSAIISGLIADPMGTDANNEYIQFIATRDINFAVTPFSVVTTNNAGASTPTGFPTRGWATGDVRTYKFNLTSGTVSKGEFFYVGGANKLINSTGSTSIASAKWIRSFNYSTTDGDGFGTKTTNLLANSGNAYGVALFEGTAVDVNTRPIDCVFISSGGSLFSAGPPAVGYRIANNDFYDAINPITLAAQPFYRQGTNTLFFPYHPNTVADQGYYYKFGGIYSVTLGKWVKVRSATHFQLTKTSQLNEIEGVFPAPSADNPDGVPATALK
ncbi:hypothetical protein DU508_01770 [Pedobacter chinensis]|uniref:DUF5689 domain-containing protein n=1 Tax=Pedobacter chinensis TaxID=2282421 RepID=A0A369Q0V8_9SPHI|nr:DUF5689 domain-containing protein [Pedobacter chinensis]RDC58374.1 hypothetical protein DU508_01770 [Pedobacter chinensis]